MDLLVELDTLIKKIQVEQLASPRFFQTTAKEVIEKLHSLSESIIVFVDRDRDIMEEFQHSIIQYLTKLETDNEAFPPSPEHDNLPDPIPMVDVKVGKKYVDGFNRVWLILREVTINPNTRLASQGFEGQNVEQPEELRTYSPTGVWDTFDERSFGNLRKEFVEV